MQRNRVGPVAAGEAEDWLANLDAETVEFLLLDAEKDASLLGEVEAHPGWMIELWDGESVFLCRTPAFADARLVQQSSGPDSNG